MSSPIPVCMAVADTRTRAKDWETLLREVEIGKWGASEFVRHAYESLAQERQNEHDASVALWKQAVTATEQRPERLEALAQLAFDWHWEDRGTELLWKLTATGSAPRKVLDKLWEAAARTRNTEQMRTISRLRMKADPRSIEARNNFAFLSLLTRSTEGGIHEIADALYNEAPGNPEAVATYAFSLYRREKIAEALSAMQALKPEQLREPRWPATSAFSSQPPDAMPMLRNPSRSGKKASSSPRKQNSSARQKRAPRRSRKSSRRYFQGFTTRTPVPLKSATLRVTSVRSCSSAVAAIRPSASEIPVAAAIPPHRSATVSVTGRNCPANSSSTPFSHPSRFPACIRSVPRSPSIPLRISPTVMTLSAQSDGWFADTQF